MNKEEQFRSLGGYKLACMPLRAKFKTLAACM